MFSIQLGLGIGSFKMRPIQNPLQRFGASRLVRWYDLSDQSSVTIDGSNRISQLNDKSGNGRHAVQATAGSRPLYNGSTTINGLRTMYHDSTARFLQGTVTAADLNALGQHVFIVAEWDTLNTYSAVYSRHAATAGNNEFNLLKQNNTAPANSFYAQYSQDGTAVSTIGKVTQIAVGTPYVLYGSIQNNQYVEVGVNNVRADQRSLITGSVYDDPTPPSLTIGNQSNGGVPMRGEIAEVIVVSGVLSVSEKDWILSYLGKKWGINVILSAQDETTAAVGQSNIYLWTVDDATYTNEGRIAYTNKVLTDRQSQFFFNGSSNGSAVLEAADTGLGHWIKNDLADGPSLTGFMTNAAGFAAGIKGDLSRYENILIANGEADATAIANGTITKAQFKTALLKLVDRLNEVCPYTRLIFTPIGRRTGGNDSATQQVRDTQLEIIAQKSYCYLGWENYDQPLQDSIHRTPLAYTTEGTRAAEFILTGNLRGPQIISATYSGSTIIATVQLDSGASISGSDVNTFRIEDDGVPVTISNISIAENVITLTLASSIANGSVVKLWVNYGQGAGVVTANVIKDSNGYPLRTQSGMDVL